MTDGERSPLASDAHQLDELSKVFSDVAHIAFRLKAVFETPEARKIIEAVSTAATWVVEFQKRARELVLPLSEFFQELAAKRRAAELIAGAGWLPHRTTPLAAISAEMTTDQVHQVLTAFYGSEFDAVEKQFLSSIEMYNLDEQVRSTFIEALSCHRQGFYRASVRLLFPEIERLARVHLYDGKLNGITSLPNFAASVGKIPLGKFPDVEGPLELYCKLESHLYMKVRDTEAIAAVAADPVPNRHAAIHGLVDYNTMQNSINSLIMSDFIFQLFCCLKGMQSQMEAQKND